MTDTTIGLFAAVAGTAGPQVVSATFALFAPTDVGRGLSIRCYCPARQAATAYALGAVFYSEYAGVDRVYRVVAPGTTAVFKDANTIPDYDVNAPREATDSVVDGTAGLKYLGAGKLAWGFGVITAYVSPTQVVVNVDPTGPFASVTPSLRWRLGEWGPARGYPFAVTFWQQRTYWGGTATKPDTVWTSQSGDFETMTDEQVDGTVLDTDALTLGLDDDQVNTVRWMSGIPRGLALGVASGEFLLGPASTVNAAISPTNVRALRQGDRGSADIAGIRVSGVVLFVQRAGLKLRQLEYDFATDSFTTADLCQLADHIAGPGFVEMAYQEEPNGTLWLVRADGVLVSLTFDREQKVRAWCRHVLGGGGLVESVAVVPAPDGACDDVYLSVVRYPNGQAMRTTEIMQRPFRADLDGAAGAYMVDCGLTYQGDPATRFAGLDHLEGQTVDIVADGAVRPAQVVTGGAVTIASPGAGTVHVGLHYDHEITTLSPNADAGGRTQGDYKKLGDVIVRLSETRGGSIGRAGGRMERLQLRPRSAPLSQAEPLYSGDYRMAFPAGSDREAQITILGTQPLPMTVLDIMVDMVADA